MTVKLRSFARQDAERIAELLGDGAVARWTSNIPFPYTDEDAIEWISKRAKDNTRRPFAIEFNGALVGCISFWRTGEKEFEIGYWVGEAFWSQGICTQALSLLMSHPAFPTDCKVSARVMAGNIGSERVLQKCGFKRKLACDLKKTDKIVPGYLYVLQSG